MTNKLYQLVDRTSLVGNLDLDALIDIDQVAKLFQACSFCQIASTNLNLR